MKEHVDTLRSLSPLEIVVVSMLFISTIAGGGLVIFLYDPKMFMDMDMAKLVILALSISVPLVMLNTFLVSLPFEKTEFKEHLAVAGVATALALYIPIIVRYVFEIKFGWFLVIVAVVEFTIFLVAGSLLDRKGSNKVFKH